MARAFASFVSVIGRSSSVRRRSVGVASSLLALSVATGTSPVCSTSLGHLLRAELAHGEELEHAVLHVPSP